jgi:DNA gyrase subunit B
MATKKVAEYDSSHIETLRFPESIRRNPSMYLGSVDASGVWLCARELLDNGLDEHLAGRNDSVHLHVDSDGSYWVTDNGHGIPQGIKKWEATTGSGEKIFTMSTMQAVFGELHTSGKYRDDAYKISVGTHGVGAKGTNATADFFDACTFFKGKWHTIGFKKGKLTSPVAAAKTAPKLWNGKRPTSGTVIHFKPDSTIFSAKSFPASMAVEWAEIMSYLNPGFSITISSAKGAKQFLSKKGPTEYVAQRMLKLKTEGERQMFENSSSLADVVVAFSNYDGCDVRGFTNGLNNGQGGKHVDSVTGALYAGLKPFIKTKKVDGKQVPVFREADLKEGLVGLVNAKLHKAQFSSQDKAKLTDDRVGKDFETALTLATTKFFKENKALAQRIADRATQMNELKTKFTMSKKAAGKLNAVKRNGLPAKYAAFDSRTKPQDRELFLVEGDSAGGTTKEARFPYQGVLPLRGKILNSLKDNKGKALESEEVINILAAIGYDVKASDPYSKLTIGKIICLADPDPDGPFVRDTKIRVRINGSEYEREIYELTAVDRGGPYSVAAPIFEVPVWTGAKETWAPATAELVKNVDTLVALEIGGTKYKVDMSHKWMCLVTNAMYGRRTQPTNFDNLVYVASEDLKIGDRVFLPSSNKSRNPSSCDKLTGLGFAPVSKMRIQKLKEPVPVYCLTVPRYHNFILPSGIVSSNCHINSLLLTLFYRYLPELFKKGMVYVSNAPEFYAVHKGQLITGDTVSETQKKLLKFKAPSTVLVNHIKGWGELDANLMRILAMNPETRKVIRIKAIESDDKVDFVKLMDDNVQYRRDMLGLPSSSTGNDAEEAPVKKVVAVKKALIKRKAA